jgi:hypothetical protein
MSDGIALVVATVFWLWFFAGSTGLASYWRYERVPRRARSLIALRPLPAGPTRVFSVAALIGVLVVSQVAPVLGIIEDRATLTPLEFAILSLEPILSLLWAIYLVRALSRPARD